MTFGRFAGFESVMTEVAEVTEEEELEDEIEDPAEEKNWKQVEQKEIIRAPKARVNGQQDRR